MINRSSVFSALLILTLAASGFRSDQPVRYFLAPTLASATEQTKAFTFEFNDELGNDTLFQNLSLEGYPVTYHRRLQASVCFDDKCRLLDVIIYWNVTGRYLGFELPPKEFLSKSDHKAFTEDEYRQLNALLADKQSALRNLSYEELVPRQSTLASGVDGVSSATAKNVLDYIVKGAAFTTYKMWHFIYGPTLGKVEELTIGSLSSDLILQVLESPDAYDKLWALNHINGYVKTSPALLNKLLNYIDNKNYSLSERAINAISVENMRSDSVQIALMNKFSQAGYSQKKLLVNKIKDASLLNDQVRDQFARELPALSAELVADVLNLFKKMGVKDAATCRSVSGLLKKENNFIAQKALTFLEQAGPQDEAILTEIKNYKSRQDK
jgi:hypothetical protein